MHAQLLYCMSQSSVRFFSTDLGSTVSIVKPALAGWVCILYCPANVDCSSCVVHGCYGIGKVCVFVFYLFGYTMILVVEL